MYVWVYFWSLYSVPFYLFLCQYHTILTTIILWYSIMLSADSFIISLTILMHFIYFSQLIAVAGNSNTMLIKMGRVGILPCSWSERKSFSCSPLSVILAVYWSYTAYIELCSLHTHLGKSLYHIRLLNFLKCFFCIWGNGHMLFILYFLNTTVSIDWSVILKHPCIPGIYLTWSYCMTL